MLPMTTRPAQPEPTYQRTTATEAATMTPAVDLIKYQPPTPPPSVDALILAYWLMFCRAPRKAQPDETGAYSLGEIGADVEKNWSRLTPYSIARREP